VTKQIFQATYGRLLVKFAHSTGGVPVCNTHVWDQSKQNVWPQETRNITRNIRYCTFTKDYFNLSQCIRLMNRQTDRWKMCALMEYDACY